MSNENVTGELVVSKLPLDECYPTPADFVSLLPQYLAILLTGSAGDVVLSPLEPGADDLSKLWVKIDNNRNFTGLFLYQNGAWVQVSDAYVGEIRWFDSSITLPSGWTKLATVKASDLPQEAISGATSVPSNYTLARYDRS